MSGEAKAWSNITIVFHSTAELLENLCLQRIYPLPFHLLEVTWKAYCSWGAFCFTCGVAAGWGAAVAGGPGHHRDIGLCTEYFGTRLLRDRAYLHMTVASHSSTSTTFGLRMPVCKQIGNLFLLPVPSRTSPSVGKIYNAQDKLQRMRYSAGTVSSTVIGYQSDLFTYYLIFMWRQC